MLLGYYLLNVGRDGDSVKVDRQTEILIVGRFTVEGILEQSTAVNTRGAFPKPVWYYYFDEPIFTGEIRWRSCNSFYVTIFILAHLDVKSGAVCPEVRIISISG